MPDPVTADISIEKVQKAIELIVKIADSLTKMIPGDVDDRVVFILKQFADQEWFAELVITMINAFGPDKPVSKEEAFKLVGAVLAAKN